MRSAAAAKVERVVQTSSLSAVMYGRDNPNERIFTEVDWTNPDHRDNVPYARDGGATEVKLDANRKHGWRLCLK